MNKKHIRTQLVHLGENTLEKKIKSSVSVPKVLPVYMSSVFSFDDVETLDAVYAGEADGYVYSRMSNPGTDAVEELLSAAEGADGAVVFASGMAAIINTVLAFVKQGDHIVSSPVLYGGVYTYFKSELPKYGIEVSFVDFDDPDEVKKAIRPSTKIIYTETISNPLMEVVDICAISKISKECGCKFIIDNTFATSSICRPLNYGADIVVYSATKYLGGHSDIIGGAVCSNMENIEKIRNNFTLYGAIMGPMEAWLLSRSMRTLDMRIEQHSKNALEVAEFLEKHPKIERVYYPGLKSSKYHNIARDMFMNDRFGGMLSADIINGEKGAADLIKNCETIKFVPSLAGYSTSISYPAKTSHRSYSAEDMKKAGISMGQLRFSIGLEDAKDIIDELSAALEKV